MFLIALVTESHQLPDSRQYADRFPATDKSSNILQVSQHFRNSCDFRPPAEGFCHVNTHRSYRPRADGRLHGLGQTKYLDDLYLPGMLYAKIKRAGIASARITSIDTTAVVGGRGLS